MNIQMGDDHMERKVGTISRGIRCPIIRQNDDLADIVVKSVLDAAESEGFELRDRDVISLTESIVARAQGNYATVDAIAEDVRTKLGGETIGVMFPILSRNRFSICLKGIAMGAKKVVLMLSYPSDEVGNALLTYDQLDEANINPYSDVLTLGGTNYNYFQYDMANVGRRQVGSTIKPYVYTLAMENGFSPDRKSTRLNSSHR